jgi:tetratricopeptide (TPR) repeat protein
MSTRARRPDYLSDGSRISCRAEGSAMFRIAFSLAVAVIAGAATSAHGQGNPSEQQACFDRRADQPTDLDRRVTVCSAVIDNGDLAADVRNEARLRRALAYAERAAQLDSNVDLDRAIIDLSMGLEPGNRAAESYVYQMRGGLYYHRGHHDLALADYTALIALEPNSPTAHAYRGVVYAAKGSHTEAVADFSEAIRLDPKGAASYGRRALSYLELGKVAEALADADQAAALDPNNSASYSTRIVVNRALGKTDEVVSDLKKALSLDPDNEAIKEELRLAEAPAVPPEASVDPVDPEKLARDIQAELKRVGCDPGSVDGKWGKNAEMALQKFASHAKVVVSLEPAAATLEILTAQQSRVCP